MSNRRDYHEKDRSITILGIAVLVFFILVISCAAELQSFNTSSGKIALDAPWHLILADEQYSIDGDHLYGCKDNMCWYGFYTSNDPKHILFTIAFDKIVDDNRTFEKIVEQKYAINDLPTEQFEKEVDSNFTLAFVPRGEWTTTNEGRKMYFEGKPYEDPITGSHIHNPYALIDFANTSQIVDIEAAYADSDAILSISKSFKFTAKAAEQQRT